MPKDSTGKFHLNTQRANAASKFGAPKPPMAHPAVKEEKPPMGGGGGHTTLHDKGDGSYRTEGHDGEEMDHPHLAGALSHMAGKHGDDALANHIGMMSDDEPDGDEAPMQAHHAGKMQHGGSLHGLE